jgi:hypothetical protein
VTWHVLGLIKLVVELLALTKLDIMVNMQLIANLSSTNTHVVFDLSTDFYLRNWMKYLYAPYEKSVNMSI